MGLEWEREGGVRVVVFVVVVFGSATGAGMFGGSVSDPTPDTK